VHQPPDGSIPLTSPAGFPDYLLEEAKKKKLVK
jgi:hypothetical protein